MTRTFNIKFQPDVYYILSDTGYFSDIRHIPNFYVIFTSACYLRIFPCSCNPHTIFCFYLLQTSRDFLVPNFKISVVNVQNVSFFQYLIWRILKSSLTLDWLEFGDRYKFTVIVIFFNVKFFNLPISELFVKRKNPPFRDFQSNCFQKKNVVTQYARCSVNWRTLLCRIRNVCTNSVCVSEWMSEATNYPTKFVFWINPHR